MCDEVHEVRHDKASRGDGAAEDIGLRTPSMGTMAVESSGRSCHAPRNTNADAYDNAFAHATCRHDLSNRVRANKPLGEVIAGIDHCAKLSSPPSRPSHRNDVRAAMVRPISPAPDATARPPLPAIAGLIIYEWCPEGPLPELTNDDGMHNPSQAKSTWRERAVGQWIMRLCGRLANR